MTTPTLPQALADAGWTLADGGKAIDKTFRFKTFPAALAWMVRAGFEAERMDHHPEWSNVYNKVTVRLTTHDTGGLSDKDIALAERFEAVGG